MFDQRDCACVRMTFRERATLAARLPFLRRAVQCSLRRAVRDLNTDHPGQSVSLLLRTRYPFHSPMKRVVRVVF